MEGNRFLLEQVALPRTEFVSATESTGVAIITMTRHSYSKLNPVGMGVGILAGATISPMKFTCLKGI